MALAAPADLLAPTPPRLGLAALRLARQAGMVAKTGVVVVPPAVGGWLNGDGAAYRGTVMKGLASRVEFRSDVECAETRFDPQVMKGNDGGDLPHLWQACRKASIARSVLHVVPMLIWGAGFRGSTLFRQRRNPIAVISKPLKAILEAAEEGTLVPGRFRRNQ